MRRCLETLVFMSLLLVMAHGSWAVNLPGGTAIKMKFTNWDVGVLYDVADGTYTGAAALDLLPQLAPLGAAPGEDAWGIFRLESITNATGSEVYWNRFAGTTWNPTPTEITGIFWGESDTYLEQSTILGKTNQNIHGVDMHYAFFEDSSLDFNNFNADGGTGTPEAWNGGPFNRATPDPVWDLTTNNGPSSGFGIVRGGAGTSADSAPIWTGTSVPGFNTAYPTDEFFTSFWPEGPVFGSENAAGGFFGDLGAVPYWGTGTNNSQLVADPSGVAFRFAFTGVAGDGGWIVMSDDPVLTTTQTPELSSAVLLLLGLIPVGLGWRRRRSA